MKTNSEVAHPNCKINIGLHITGVRPNGYHDIETVFYPVPLTDSIMIERRSTAQADVNGTKWTLTEQPAPSIPGNARDNLIVRAYELLDADFSLPAVSITLRKHIPFGAGLGGGSSDAAFTLRTLNDMFHLRLTDEELCRYAGRLGADCAFFIKNKPLFACGVGDEFSPTALTLSGYRLLLVKPDVAVSTREAYARVTPRQPRTDLRDLAAIPVDEWKEAVVNDFEESVFPQYPVIGHLKQALYDAGAVYASMSGSGSSVFGLFRPGDSCPDVPPFPASGVEAFGCANAFTYTCVLP